MRPAARLGLLLCVSLPPACGLKVDPDAPKRIEKLKGQYDELHKRFEEAAAKDPVMSTAFSHRGQVVIAIRSGLIEELAGNVAARYLDRVTLDLAAVHAHSTGELEKKTFLGKMKLGEWSVWVELGTMVGHLRAAQPIVGLRPPDLIDIDLPVDVEETVGDATLHFEWNSKGVANAVCKDFETTQVVKGRVVAQRHHLKGALQLANAGGRLTETPLFPDRKIQVQMDLTAESWAALEKTLQEQDTLDKCGMFTKASDGMVFLRELAAKGISVKLPDKIFRAVDLPAQLQQSVQVNKRPIGLQLTAEALRVDTATLWSSVSVVVHTKDR